MGQTKHWGLKKSIVRCYCTAKSERLDIEDGEGSN